MTRAEDFHHDDIMWQKPVAGIIIYGKYIKEVQKMRSRGFTIVELMVVLIIVMILGGIGFVAYTRYIEGSKVAKLQADLKEYGTALLGFYTDTGALPGLEGGPFPDVLASTSSIQDQNVKDAWKGPYIKTAAVCPFTGCVYEVDYTTGQANVVGQVYQYFVVARQVPLKNAIELSKRLNGDRRVNECLTSNIASVASGVQSPCAVYLSQNTGGSATKVDVYYTFASGSY